jgi:demethylmenaquinone methyltransferase / 2-methoxy-6-polyprenyl-1,4-benzoquinol methylase
LENSAVVRANLNKDPDDVSKMFDDVANRYDFLNDLLSLGRTKAWRRAVTSIIAPKPGMKILDIAAGTGSSSRPLVDKGAEVTALDFSRGMIEQGRKQNKNINFVQGDALKLPFEDNSFEVTTISFGLRNTSSTEIALKEALRVTKDGGRIVVAEFSHPVNPIFKKIYLNYLMKALPVIVKKISKNPDAYIYLADSIRAWPDQAELASIMRDSGFKSVAWQDLTFGIVAVHIGYKA